MFEEKKISLEVIEEACQEFKEKCICLKRLSDFELQAIDEKSAKINEYNKTIPKTSPCPEKIDYNNLTNEMCELAVKAGKVIAEGIKKQKSKDIESVSEILEQSFLDSNILNYGLDGLDMMDLDITSVKNNMIVDELNKLRSCILKAFMGTIDESLVDV